MSLQNEIAKLETMNYAELVQLRDAVADRMKDMRDSGITQLRATIVQQAAILEIDIQDLVSKKTRKKGSSAKYRDPDTGETYIGKGKHPQWLKDKLAAGHGLEDFRAT